MDEKLTFNAKAHAAWLPAPDWVIELAEIADSRGLSGAADAIGYSASLVSSVLANKYKGDVDRVAEKVRGALMGKTVSCPRLDDIPRDVCLDWQSKPFAPTSPQRVEMYHLCRSGCPHFRGRGGADGDR